MVRIIGFMLCIFHHNFKKERDGGNRDRQCCLRSQPPSSSWYQPPWGQASSLDFWDTPEFSEYMFLFFAWAHSLRALYLQMKGSQPNIRGQLILGGHHPLSKVSPEQGLVPPYPKLLFLTRNRTTLHTFILKLLKLEPQPSIAENLSPPSTLPRPLHFNSSFPLSAFPSSNLHPKSAVLDPEDSLLIPNTRPTLRGWMGLRWEHSKCCHRFWDISKSQVPQRASWQATTLKRRQSLTEISTHVVRTKSEKEHLWVTLCSADSSHQLGRCQHPKLLEE